MEFIRSRDGVARGSVTATSRHGKARLKVVHLASGDTWGGAERVIVELASQSRRDSHVDVEALLFNEGRLAGALRESKVPIHVIAESTHSFLSLVAATRRYLTVMGADVVHAHRYKEILAAAFAVLVRRSGLVVTVHGLEPRSQLTYRQLPRFWAPLLAARLVGARFVGVSGELTRRLVRRLGRQQVTHIPNPMPRVDGRPVPPDLRTLLGWNSSRPIVGFVGRLEHVKGPDRFVEIAARCHRDIGFVLIGTGALDLDLRARVATTGLGDRIAFLDEVPEATGYLRQLDVLALPSRHEGLPMVLLEAAACEVPVVAFNVGGVGEVLDGGPAARLIRPGDEEGFLGAVEELVKDRAQVQREVARWARSVRARFSPAVVLSDYLAVYRTATRRP